MSSHWLRLVPTNLRSRSPAMAFGLRRSLQRKLKATTAELIIEVQEKTIRPSISIGIAPYDPDLGIAPALDSSHQLLVPLIAEDNANVIAVASNDDEEESPESASSRAVLEQITDAIENKRFVLLFQPIISLRGDADEPL